MKTDISDALEMIRRSITPIAPDTVDIGQAQGRRLAADIRAQNDYPPFSRSPYDGYAFRSEDRRWREVFSVIGDSFAGHPFNGAVESMQAVKIMTGGAIPAGADCVVPWEDTDRGEKEVRIYASLKPWENYIKQGEDFLRGDILLEKDTEINAAEAALAAAGGNGRVKVYPKFRAAVISTGDELVPPGKDLENGRVYDTNMIYVSFRLRKLGVDVVYTAYTPDDEDMLIKTISGAAERADVVFTTGGVSAGEKDLVPYALEKAGAKTVFKGLNIKPGMPTMLALAQNGTPVLALSGNPFAAAVGFELAGREVLAALSGDRGYLPCRSEAVLKKGYPKTGGAERYVRALEKDGYVSAAETQGNGSLKTMAGCNCLVKIPAGSKELRDGERVEIIYV